MKLRDLLLKIKSSARRDAPETSPGNTDNTGNTGNTDNTRHPKDPAATLNERDLLLRAGRNIRLIAILGILLILADLVLSFTAQTVPILQKDGRLYLLRPAAGDDTGHISLNGTVRAGRQSIEHRFDILLDPQQESAEGSTAGSEASSDASGGREPEASAQELIRSEFRSIAAGFNDDTASRLVPLPQALTSGETIRWRRVHSTNTFLLAGLTAAICILLYRSRLRPLQRLEQLQRSSVLHQLPAFLNELVLLLGAGLVLSRAFEVTVERSFPEQETDTDYFRQNIRRIYHSVKYTNGSMQSELQQFACSSGVTELMRVSNIITDNINKGVSLNEKLERESQELWLARKLRAEEQGRLAETKMTIPLSIFLSVLIIITVAPALLQL